ncbi:transporter substrate-binding domain-containing protein [Pseudomonas sp. WS 5111]|jgi:two-component system sensor histidine kinase EvgS|uniref:ATP-binding protein n=1 Tax=unclassified Pseudomonas TaxID=196821 RepID=UPI001474A8B2|nr:MULTISPECIES: transporter substrate-binding domain-containing protein [unclassified Pseudomonas]NMX68317.1 transporter substrate-binding domain-containing protein [Pseudomonas sp. WS 5111]NMX84843.1 transporter substrate-binding domain-containing protein [Pseudomonas sp. WS 5010]
MNAKLLRLLLIAFVLGNLGVGVQAGPTPLELTQQERDWIAAHPVLRVGVFDNLLPFEYISNGQLRGLSAKYLGLIASRTGLYFEPVTTTTRSARKDMLISGEVDILSTRRRDDDPAKDLGLRYTTPYNTSSTVIVSRFGDQPFADLEQLAGKRVVMLGREEDYVAFLKRKAPGITIVSALNALDMMAMVKDGRTDAAIASEWLLIPYLSRQYHGVLQISGVLPLLHTGVSMAVRDSDVLLLSILDKVLASISGEERKAIYDAWFADMDLDIPTVKAIAEHYQSELWLLLAVVAVLVGLVVQSRLQRRQAMNSEREKAMFLAVISHEVRSPMNAVLASVELLEHTPLDEQQRHFTGLANSGANTLLRLVDDVLDISKMEAGQLALNLEPVDPWALVLRVVDEHRTQAQEKGIELLVTGERPGDPLLLDELRLAQVLRNLICNAVKFTDVGRVEVQLLQLEKPAVEVRQLVIRVIDTGIGLSKQAQASLFRPYAQAKQSYRRTGGTGLGLVICRRLVRLMRGRLVLSSLQGVGTQVEVRLPVERAVSPQLPAPEPAPSAESANGLQVLVVDDSLPSRQVLQAQLDSLGCAVLPAADADQAVALFSAHRVDMVLIDCDSPEGDAERMVSAFRESQLQQERSYCPIIALSQFSGNEYLQRCFDAGMDGVLSKPLQQVMLQQMIELWCEVTPAPQVAEYPETPGSPEAVRQELNSLIELLALRDRGMALEALHRLRTAALDVGWEDFAATAQRIEVLLQDEVNWPAEAVAGHARSLLEHRAGLPCGA